jgi:hypothetical protein
MNPNPTTGSAENEIRRVFSPSKRSSGVAGVCGEVSSHALETVGRSMRTIVEPEETPRVDSPRHLTSLNWEPSSSGAATA